MKYLFILDYARLDQSAFLKHMARSLAGLKLESFMMIHADSEYTSRITESGILTEIARIRAVKELNHRLTALFADEGIPLISLNSYQRKTIVRQHGSITVNAEYLKGLVSKTNVLLSNLIEDENGSIIPLPLAELAACLHEAIGFTHLIAFDANDRPESLIFTGKEEAGPPSERPAELKDADLPLKLIQPAELATAERFQKRLNITK